MIGARNSGSVRTREMWPRLDAGYGIEDALRLGGVSGQSGIVSKSVRKLC